MDSVVVLESAHDGGDTAVVITSAIWARMCTLGREAGHAVSDERILGRIDAKLFAGAILRTLATKPASAGRSLSAGDLDKVYRSVALLEKGPVIVTVRART